MNDKIYDSLMAVAPAILDKYFKPTRCIVATRLGIEALAYFGIPASPLPCRVDIFNPEYCKLRAAGVADPNELLAGGAYMVSIDAGNHRGGYGGHLMIELPDGVMDLNFGQFSRPLKNMTLPEVMGFAELGADGPSCYELNGCTIVIRRVSDAVFKTAPDWTQPYKRVTGEIIRAMKREMQ